MMAFFTPDSFDPLPLRTVEGRPACADSDRYHDDSPSAQVMASLCRNLGTARVSETSGPGNSGVFSFSRS